jgi:UDP-glucuronate 4-epimerase
MASILVTGSAGFIGFHVANALLDAGHKVVGVDSFIPYYPLVLKRARHAALLARTNFLGLDFDVADNPALVDLIRSEKIDTICHLAAQPGVRYSLHHPFEYGQSNLVCFLSILEAVRRTGLSRLVYASSSSVYGGNTKLPFSETDPVEKPVSLYAATKRANELMAHSYTHLYGFQTVALRFFTVYGPWGRPDMAVWDFTQRIAHGRSIDVYNNGDMRRDFTYVDDVAAGVTASLAAEGLEPAEILNLGNHQSEQLLDMIKAIGEELGREPQMVMKPMQPGDVYATYADIERAGRLLGFHPSTPMKVGIQRFVDWFKANPDLTEAVYREMHGSR